MTKLLLKHKRWLIPLLLLIILAPLTPALDIATSNFFFRPDMNDFTNNGFYSFIYHYAQLPAFILFGISLSVLALSYIRKNLIPYRNIFLVFVLAMMLGPGLIINVLLKPGWGRPRPRQIEQFSGTEPYQPFYAPRFGYTGSDKYKSFPSGHASMGFYFFVVAVVGSRLKNRPMIIVGYTSAIVLGVILGITRVAQGGHFFSDIVIAALITWWVALIVDWMVFEESYERVNGKTA